MPSSVIVDAVRTPVGAYRGELSAVRPDDLAAHVLCALVKRTGIDPAAIEEVVLGCTNQAGEDNRNVARMALLLAGLPHSVAGITVNRLCASGLDAIIYADRAIRAGEGDIWIAGGVESMTRAPFALGKAEIAFDRTATLYDTTLGWRFPNPRLEALFPLESMGETAENIAAETKIARERQDTFALESQRRAVAAINAGRFQDEIVPVPIPQRKGDLHWVSIDGHPQMKQTGEHFEMTTTLERLAALKPAFRQGGTVTAGNASGLNDGAAALLLMAEERAQALGLHPLASNRRLGDRGRGPAHDGLWPNSGGAQGPGSRRLMRGRHGFD